MLFNGEYLCYCIKFGPILAWPEVVRVKLATEIKKHRIKHCRLINRTLIHAHEACVDSVQQSGRSSINFLQMLLGLVGAKEFVNALMKRGKILTRFSHPPPIVRIEPVIEK